MQLDACCINLEVFLNNTTGAMIEIDFPYTFYAMGTFGFELLKVRYFGEILFFSKCHCNFLHAKCIGLNEILDLGEDSLTPNQCTTY